MFDDYGYDDDDYYDVNALEVFTSDAWFEGEDLWGDNANEVIAIAEAPEVFTEEDIPFP